MWRTAVQLALLACAAGLLWYGIEATSGNLITCETPWQRMKPTETCTDTDEDTGKTITYTYAEWKPVMESKALVFVIFGGLGVAGAAGWTGVSVALDRIRRGHPQQTTSS